MRRPVAGLLALALLHAPSAGEAQSRAPLTRVFVGTFVTLDSANPRAEAIAVRDGRIVAVGSRQAVRAAAGRGAPVMHLPGITLPGFVDAHVHAAMFGDVLETIDLRGASKAQVLARVAHAARRAPAGAWIRGGGWDQSFWSPPEFPTARELDGASVGHPVVLERIDGHAVWANTIAMQRAGVDRSTADPPGGRLLRDRDGTPTGIFVDEAIPLVRRAEPPMSGAERVRRLRRALQAYANLGLTGVHDAGIDRATLAAYRTMLREGPLPVRVYAMASASDSLLDDVLAQGPEVGLGDGTFTLRTIKVVDDGALGSRGARLADPYSDDAGQRGFSMVPGRALDSLIARARARGFQVAVHAIGDASNHDVIAAFARAGAAPREARFRLEHASMIRNEDVPRLASLGIIASMQPVFVGEYSRFAESRVGRARLPWTYRTADVVASGAHVASGTDFPASDTGDPILTLASMVTRQGYDGLPRDGWLPSQRVSVNVAVRSMTGEPAWASFTERELGRLAPGFRADFTGLSADPFSTPTDRLRALRVLHTFRDGRRTDERR